MIRKVFLLLGCIFLGCFLLIVCIGFFANPHHFSEKTIFLSASPDVVWSYLTDVQSLPKYRKEIKKVTIIAVSESEKIRYMQQTNHGVMILELKEEKQKNKLRIDSVKSNLPIHATWRYTLNPENKGTLLKVSQELESRSFWTNAILSFIGTDRMVEQLTKVIKKNLLQYENTLSDSEKK